MRPSEHPARVANLPLAPFLVLVFFIGACLFYRLTRSIVPLGRCELVSFQGCLSSTVKLVTPCCHLKCTVSSVSFNTMFTLLYFIIIYSKVQQSSVQFSIIEFNSILYSKVWQSLVQYSIVQQSLTQFSSYHTLYHRQYSIVQHGMCCHLNSK